MSAREPRPPRPAHSWGAMRGAGQRGGQRGQHPRQVPGKCEERVRMDAFVRVCAHARVLVPARRGTQTPQRPSHVQSPSLKASGKTHTRGTAGHAALASVSPRDLCTRPVPRVPHERDGEGRTCRREDGRQWRAEHDGTPRWPASSARRAARGAPPPSSPVLNPPRGPSVRTHLPRLQSGDPGLPRPAPPRPSCPPQLRSPPRAEGQ